MRIGSNTIVDQGVYALQLQQNALLQTQQQISTNRRMVTPSDDPVAAARALEVQQLDNINTQFTTNRTAAKNATSLNESILGSVTSAIQDSQTLLLQAGSGALTASDRQILATNLNSNLQQLLGLANSTDGAGNYIFAGSKSSTLPFASTASGVQYMGDTTQSFAQISTGRQIQTLIPGSDIFMNVKNGNGTFVTSPAATNTGNATIDNGVVLDPTKWNSTANSKNLSIKFSSNGGVTVYDIVDNTTNTSLLTNAPAPAPLASQRTYTSGQAISLSGLASPYNDFGAQVTITGAPGIGDSFSLQASANQSVFTTLQNVITALQTAGTSTAALQNALTAANQNLSNALGNVLNVRASNGSAITEIDKTQTTGDALGLQYKQTLSSLQDLDLTKALSQLSQQQTSYQAALKSFQAVQGLSLFSYM